jgi:hypothetical protein
MTTTETSLEISPDPAPDATAPSFGARVREFLLMPFRPLSLGRALYNLIAFPLGLVYFVALTVGTAMGVPLTLIWIGFLILAITGALLWGFVSFERELAKLLLGARLAPMAAPPRGPRSVTQRVGDFLGNPVVWKGAAFLILKFPLGIASFTAVVTGLSVTGAFLLGPFLFRDFGFLVDLGFFEWRVDTLPEAFVLSLWGLVLLFITLHVLNALGIVWRYLAEGLLGSESHRMAEMPAAAATAV